VKNEIQNSAYRSLPQNFFERIFVAQWILTDFTHQPIERDLMGMLEIPPVIARILVNRGIRTKEEARRFFNPEWRDLYDPFLMKGMEKAVDRIVRALDHERIFIFGDYDVDGITGVSMLYLFLKEQGAEVTFYIPDRIREGYGLSETGVREAEKRGATLMITVDCGITAVHEVELANQLGIDVIVTDHHEQGKSLPNALAILNPKQEGCPYPFKELAGVGVAFKLVQGLCQRLGLDEACAKQYLDLVALGSSADIVPLLDENRILVKLGLEKLNRLERHGIRALAEISGLLGKPISTGQVVFILAPRINAVGRLGDAERAVHLLITDSEERARTIAHVHESENRNRKTLDEDTFQEAKGMIERIPWQSSRALVLSKQGWHPGVIGIVASRIVEQYYRPTILIALDEDIGKGSARSIPNFDIHAGLKACEAHLLGFGGHKYAAGLVIHSKDVDRFREAFEKIAEEWIREEDLLPRIWIDAEIALPEITDRFVRLLNSFSPFGPQNMRPVFLARHLQVVGTPRVVGKNHLKFKVRQNGQVFDAIGFGLGDLLYRLSPGDPNLDLVFVIEETMWNGAVKVQLRIKDLK